MMFLKIFFQDSVSENKTSAFMVFTNPAVLNKCCLVTFNTFPKQ